MITMNRMHGAIAFVLLTVSSAYAQQQPAQEPTLTDPPKETEACDNPDINCPPQAQQQPTTTTTTTTTGTTEPPMYQPPPPQESYTTVETPWYDMVGFGLSVGGGVDDFVGDAFRSTTSIGGGWNVRATMGTRQYIAGEVSYIGSAQSIDALGLDNDATLVGNGVQGALRINVLKGLPVQPFVYGGAAWRHYDLTDVTINTSDVRDSDDVFEVPVGVGLSGYFYGFMADVRGEYRGSWDNDLIPTLDNDDDGTIINAMDRWSVSGSLGVEF